MKKHKMYCIDGYVQDVITIKKNKALIKKRCGYKHTINAKK